VHGRDATITANGLQLHFREWGPSAGLPLVLLHGGSAHSHWWDRFAPTVADVYRVLALDLRGHGDSAYPDPPAYRISDYADDLTAFVERLGLGRVELIGHSLGGMVATAYAGRAPALVRSLVVVDSQLKITPSGARYMIRLRHFPAPVYRSEEDAIRRFRLLPVRTTADPRLLAHVAARGIRQRSDGSWVLKFDREALSHNDPQDLSPSLHRLCCPLLFVRGAHSTLLPHAALAALQAAAPHAEVVEIPDAYHHVMLDNPEAFARHVRAFLDRVRIGAGHDQGIGT